MRENLGAKIQRFYDDFGRSMDYIDDAFILEEMKDGELRVFVKNSLDQLYEEFENLFSEIIEEDFR